MLALGIGFAAGRISKIDRTGENVPAQTADVTSSPAPIRRADEADPAGPTQTTDITATAVPTQAAAGTDTTVPTQAAAGTDTTVPTQTADVTASPAPIRRADEADPAGSKQTTDITATVAPTQAAETTGLPEPTQKPEPTKKAEPTAVPVPTAPVAKTEKGSPYEKHGRLAVNGTKLVDKNGEEYRLRGVSTHGIAWFPDYVNKQAFQTLRDDWGVNCIRLAMYTAEYNGYCSGGNKSDLKKLVDNGVKYATELGLYVIIDWHILSDSNPVTNKDEAIAFFTEMSRKYAEYGNVIFEICNEPNGGTGWSQIKSYAKEVIPAIRKNAPKAIIVVGTPTWSQEVDKAAADPIKEYDNIMYTIHFYAATHKDDLRRRMQAAVRSGIALFCTEFGTCDASGNGGNDFTEAEKWIDAMEASGVSYCIWNLSNKAETSALISSGCSKTSGWMESDLSASGKWYAKLLRSKAGAGSVSPGLGEGTGNDDPEKDRDGTAKDSGSNGIGKDGTGKDDNGNNGIEKDNSGNNDTGKDSNDNTGNKDRNSLLGQVELKQGDLSIVLNNTGGWNDGKKSFRQFTLSIMNNGNTAVENWKITLKFAGKYELSQSWNGTFEEKGSKLVIKPVDFNAVIVKGGLAEAGFIISTEEPGKMPEITDISGF